MKSSRQDQLRRQRRRTGIRKSLFGTPGRPRLTVYRSLKHIYAQIVDDLNGKTLASASSLGGSAAGGNKTAAIQVGKTVAEKAKAAGVTCVCFDRNGFRYHGRIKSLADAARESGLQF